MRVNQLSNIKLTLKASPFAIAFLLSGCASTISQPNLAKPATLGTVAADAIVSDSQNMSPEKSGVANPVNWPSAASPTAITDAATESAIDALLIKMTLEQKVGQLIQADISAVKPEDFAQYPLGSILAGGNSGPYGDERAGAVKWAQLVGEYRSASRHTGAGIPILFGIDAVHGHSNLPEATIFPHNIGLGATRDADLIERIGAATAEEISGSGIEWTFAPTLAVPQDVRWGRTYEGYSSDPAIVARYARAMTLGLQGKMAAGKSLDALRVAATAKHFLADGGTIDGRDQGDAVISEAELVAKHAQSYPAAINAGVLTVMASFSSWNGVKHHGNKTLLTDVLKDRMGFSGLVVGDWNGHGQVAGCSATNCPSAINAGIDILMAPESWKALFGTTLAAARDGRIPAPRLNDAVRRILRVKYKLGLMGDNPTQRGDARLVGAPGHLAIAREAVAKSLVLLKNNDAILPIKAGARVLIAGPGADNMAMQTGGWTISWQGSDTRADDFTNGQTIGRAIADAVRSGGGQAELSPSGNFDRKPDIAIVVLGERPYAEFEGDVPHLAFQPNSGEEEMIARLKAQGVRVAVVFLSGRPMFVGKLINQADAFVAAWLPGTQGRGVADVLAAGADGKVKRNFSGRLPFAWPSDARSPITDPLFPIGYGQNYNRSVPLGLVNEYPGVDVSARGQANFYMVRGNVPAPWRLAVDGSVTSRAADISAQEDARQFTWNAQGVLAIEGVPADLTSQAGADFALLLDWRIDTHVAGPLLLSFGGAAADISALVASAPTGSAVQTRVPMRCFAGSAANLAKVGSPFRLEAARGFVATLRNIRIEATNQNTQNVACPGHLP